MKKAMWPTTETSALPKQESRFWREIEKNEALYWRALFEGSPDAGYSRIGGATACSMPQVDVLAFNRVLGLGMQESLNGHQLEEVIAYYRQQGVRRFFAPLSPHAAPEQAGQLMEAYGFQPYNSWAKLVRSLDIPLPEVRTELEIVEVTPGWAKVSMDIIREVFGWPESVGRAFSKTIFHPSYRHYMAVIGGMPVAVAALYARPPYASMAIAATLPDYRGMGAQSALLAHRLSTARLLGCRYAVVETAAEQAGKPVQSYRNMRRFGFELAYLRPNYLYQF